MLYGPDGTEIAASGRETGAHGALAELAAVVRADRGPASAADTTAGVHLAAYALGTGGQGFALGVAAPERTPGDHTIASVAAVLLALLTGEHQSGSGAARSSALVRLLLGATPEDGRAAAGRRRERALGGGPRAARGARRVRRPIR